ncbi:uncharacterized protein CDV56_109534 [Aspergillus thermomutatus]|uniref:C2H2-type domain-containing protein n=1 Tax=Aspergillus thermomutatus TaxID=41047 RepID=A0A397HVC3_ASPTH|nr:uncharacterized protein CDV56_109534 [Aspergillus thermomutatus]RHZ67181.1 hypothetical protein CDV56_109534 [Aspergillus thermomutatus]
MQSSALSRPVGRRKPKTSKQERVCPICFKEFSKAEHLARHYRSHTKEKPFHCADCGRVYTRQDTLLRHTRSHCPRDGLGEDGTGARHVLPPTTAPGLEGLGAATFQPMSPSSNSSPSMRNVANIRRPSHVIAEHVQTATVPVEGGTNASPALDFPVSLSQNPGADFQVNESLNSTDISSVELESGWISWLLGDNFDLDAVNSSLLQATTGDLLAADRMPDEDPLAPDSFSAGTQATEARLAPSGDAIREKWHTHCGQTTSDLISPDPANDRYQIDESYRHELADRLQQRVQTGILPSTTFLWDIMIAQRPDSSIVAIQSALLGQTFGLLIGRPKDLAGIEAFHGSIIAWARRVRLLSHAATPALPPNLPNLTNGELQSAWKHWITVEERKRTLLGIFIHDAELAKMHHHETYLRLATERLPTISSDELFAANNANAWRELALQANQRSGSRTSLPSDDQSVLRSMRERRFGGTSDFEVCAMLECISAMACECQEPFSTTPDLIQKCQEKLISWYETHLSTAVPGEVWAYPLRILWHSTFILLYSNLDILERACGRDGPEAAQEAIGYARQWANSHEATRSLIHAVCIRKDFESMHIGSECPLHVPTCLYDCGIIWFCFGHFGHGSNGAIMERNFPELNLAGVHVDEIDAAELKNSQVERNAANQVFRIVGLLQSIRHWKLSLSLASTLLALIEEQDNVF